MALQIEILETADPACDRFVAEHPDGRLCHLWSWGDMIARHARHEAIYLVAREGGAIRGVLPVTYVRSRLFGDRAVSQGFNNYGGPLALDDETTRALFDRVVELVQERRGESIEFRNIRPLPYELELRSGKVCMHRTLPGDAETLWRSLDPKVRNQVRKAEKSGLTVTEGGLELMDGFYEVYARRMRQLGTPGYPRSLLDGIMRTFPLNSRLFSVSLGALPVAAGLTTSFAGFSDILYASARTEYNHLCCNPLLYWSALKHYCVAGASTFDLGRSTRESATFRFKQQWDPVVVPLAYQYWVAPGHGLRINSPDDPRFRTRVALWRRLPLWLTRIVGPAISRNLP